MQKGLARLAGVTGVGGSFVCDHGGEVLESSNPAPLATATMQMIGRQIAQTHAALESADYAVHHIEFVYDCWRLLARDLGNAQLFILCEPGADMSLVRLTADVVATGWHADKGVQKRLAGRTRREGLTRDTLDEVSWRLLNQGT